jgi:hypothetical protein
MAGPTKEQIKIIHVLKSKLGMDDEMYRSMLSGYGVKSSKDMRFEQARDLIRKLRGDSPSKKRFEDVGTRPGWAYPGQLRKIEAIWSEVSRAEGDEAKRKALNTFLGHHFGVASMEWLPVETVPKVLRALFAMKAAKAKETKKEAVDATVPRGDPESGSADPR